MNWQKQIEAEIMNHFGSVGRQEEFAEAANAILKTIAATGYAILPCEPDETMLWKGTKASGHDTQFPSRHVELPVFKVRQIYQAMTTAALGGTAI